jgi:hypothetical protein
MRSLCYYKQDVYLFCVFVLRCYLATKSMSNSFVKVTVAHLFNKIPVLYETCSLAFVTRYWTVYWASWIHSEFSQHFCFKVNFNIIILGLPSDLFPSGFPNNVLCISHFSPASCTPRPAYPFSFDHPKFMWWRAYIIQFLKLSLLLFC